jgi:murein DD-endopeptidase MepM/ murein hydrolase activator NlpD
MLEGVRHSRIDDSLEKVNSLSCRHLTNRQCRCGLKVRIMKIVRTIILFALVFVLTLPAFAQKTTTGFYFPTDQRGNTGGYYGWWAYNSAFGGNHLAQDIKSSVGSPVYAVADGVVALSRSDVGSYGGDTPSRAGGGLVVEHYTSTGRRFYVLYAHLQTDRLPAVGTRVYAGQVISYVANYKSGNSNIPHLHFGIMLDNLPNNPWRGYTSNSSKQGFDSPWVNGAGFLAQNSPASFQNLPDNSMAREYSDSAVYLIVNKGKFWVPNETEVNAFGGWGNVNLYSTGRLSDYRNAAPNNSTMYRQRSYTPVFLQFFNVRWLLLTESAVQRYGGQASVRLVPNGSFNLNEYAGTVR